MVVFVRLERSEWSEVGLHPSEVPQLDVVVVATSGNASARRVDCQRCHSLQACLARVLCGGTRAHLGMVLHHNFVRHREVLCIITRLTIILIVFVALLL